MEWAYIGGGIAVLVVGLYGWSRINGAIKRNKKPNNTTPSNQ